MSKFFVKFDGYPDDIVAEVGMSMNAFIRKLLGGSSGRPTRPIFLKVEYANEKHLRDLIVWKVSSELFAQPSNKTPYAVISDEVRKRYTEEITQWIEENKALIAEIGFLKDEP